LVVRPNSDLQQLSQVIDRLGVHVHDGSTRGLLGIVESVRPQSVFHLASLFIAEHQLDQVEPLIASNVLFGTQLLEAMRAADVHRMVNVGTSWQHFHSDRVRPSCLYAATKQAFQDILDFYTDAYGMRVVTLKLFDTYGAGDPRKKLFYLLRNAYKTGAPLAMSAGEQLVDLVHIDDVIEAFKIAEARLCFGTEAQHEVYSVSSGSPLPLRGIVELYDEIIGHGLRIDWGARPYRSREVMIPWDGNPGLPDWTPKVSLADGLARMHKEDSRQ
jgi:nucleoside-diphosphate-sugar epimerase